MKRNNSGDFKKGRVPWNKGLTKETDSRLKKASITQSKTLKNLVEQGLFKPWSLGLTKETNPSLKCLSESRKGKNNPVHNKGVKEKIQKTLIKTYKERPEILENRKPSGVNQFSSEFTSIEQPIADLLKEYQIPFKHNTKVGRYFPDFIINSNVIIECDGEYWHRDKHKEKKRDDYLMKKGYQVFHLSGKEITKNASKAINSVINQL